MRASRAVIFSVITALLAVASAREFPGFPNATTSDELTQLGALPQEMSLCDCEKATGEPNGLSCEKDGFFIAGFERTGSWVGGAGEVPLSNAICCRPCLPVTPPPGARVGDAPASVVSVACAPAEGKDGAKNRCPLDGMSFITGFEKSVAVMKGMSAAYPVGPAQCCQAAVLMRSGDVFKMERCSCVHPPTGVSCGTPPTSTNRLLHGFERSKDNHMPGMSGKSVPMAPAECCRACLSPTPLPPNCAALAHCSGHGICTYGTCECVDGYKGDKCHIAPKGSRTFLGLSSSVILMLLSGCILGCCAKAFLCACGGSRVMGAHGRGSDFGGEQMEEPLLRDEASSDYWDTETETESESEEEESEDDEEEARLRAAASARRRAAAAAEAAIDDGAESGAAGEEQEEEEGAAAAAAEGEGGEEEEGGGGEEGARAAAEEGEGEEVAPAPAEGDGAEEVVVEGQEAAEGEEVEMAECEGEAASSSCAAPASAAEPPARPSSDEALRRMECVICMSAPIKVVAIPCGHACMCRKCGKRLRRCPICRTPIARRQRLFLETHGLH